MGNPTRILIGGAILAAIVAAGGVGNTKRLESKLRSLEEECVKMVLKFPDLGIVCSEEDFVRQYGIEVLEEMLQRNRPYQAVQLKIVATERALRTSQRWWPFLATLILLASALPSAWYFLLDRIRELRHAIVGKHDA